MTDENQEGQQEHTDANQEGGEDTQGWFWAEGVPGTGPRPDYLPEKFTSVADAAKARADLEKKLGSFTGAPESYEIEHLELDPEQATLKTIIELGKELNMSQKGFDKLVSGLMHAQEAEESVSLEEQVKEMGEEGQRLMRQYKHFTENNMQPEERELAKNWVKTKDDLRMFTDLVNAVYAKRLPTDNTPYMGNHSETEDDIRAEMAKNLERYKKDDVYKKEIRNRLTYAEKRKLRGMTAA